MKINKNCEKVYKMIKRIVLFGVVSLLTTGCVTNPEISKQFTSGQTGCLEKDITITNETASANGMHNWVAECKGKKYVCSYHYGDGAKCTEMVE